MQHQQAGRWRRPECLAELRGPHTCKRCEPCHLAGISAGGTAPSKYPRHFTDTSAVLLALLFRMLSFRPAAATVRPQVKAQASLNKIAQVAGVAVSSLALTLAAHADATVKLGADSGALVFEPASLTIKSGETVVFKNNAGFPHNVVFDEDAVPEGVNVDAISKEDLLNAPGETFSVKLTTPGEYTYFCEPHQGAGMVGKITVQ